MPGGAHQSSYAAAWKGAEALRRHCHNVITALGPQTPPEAFLFRGNAYYALGKPYFALADYNAAASVLSISGSHQEKCLRAVSRFPDVQVCTYPSQDTHMHVFVSPMISEQCTIRAVSEKVGRGVFAAGALPRGATVVHYSEPWHRYPIAEDTCSFCARPLPERSFACSNHNCHEEYCSRDCRTEALARYHSAVCENPHFQRLELDVYTQMGQAEKEGDTAARNAAAAQLLTLRVMAASVTTQIVPSSMSEVRLLSGKLTFSPQVLCEGTLRLYERLANSLHVLTLISYEEMIGVLARVTANCFQTENAVEIHLARSMLNHSCNANVAEDASSGNLLTTRDVSQGEELTINYYPHLKDLPYAERQEALERRGFECHCHKCQRQL